jgi:hypothetical protein
MTDLLIEYLKHRDQGHSHHAALLALARRFDMDKGTVGRVIERAQCATHQGGESKSSGSNHRHSASRGFSPRLAKSRKGGLSHPLLPTEEATQP